MSLLPELQRLMLEYRFKPDKSFGQNFIIDEAIIAKIVDAAGLVKADTVLEIGCGTGFLTEKILEKCKVTGFENDETLGSLLEKRFSGNKKFKLVRADILSSRLPKFTKVVSLPPYHISTGIVLKLFEALPERMALVFQREFADRLTAEPGFWEYNYLSALSGMLYESEIVVRNIPPSSFFPKPESYSSLVVMNAKKARPDIKDFHRLASFMKELFRYQNKNLRNALRNSLADGSGLKASPKKLEKLMSGPIADEKVMLLSGEELAHVFSILSKK